MRYERQLFFKHIGKEGQNKLRKATVTIVGIGALGSYSAELLCRAGIGKLILIDDDTVELHNLQRQSLYDERDIDKKKVVAVAEHLKNINHEVRVEIHDCKLAEHNLALLGGVVLDGTDNMEVRYLINRHCHEQKMLWIYGAVASSIGMIYPVLPEGPCLECILPESTPTITCEADGVINTICALVASIQVTQCMKYILEQKVERDLLRITLWENEWEKIAVNKRIECPICSGNSIQKGMKEERERFTIQKCRNKAAYSLRERRQQKIDLAHARTQMEKIDAETKTTLIGSIDGEPLIIHSHGEILFKKCEDKEKMRMIAEKVFS